MQINMKKKQTFEEFLEDIAQEDDSVMRASGSDGNQEATERFIENLDVQEVIDYAQLYGNEMYLQGGKDVINEANSLATNIN